MTNRLEALARRLEDDAFFLACPLRLYADSEGMDENTLMRTLGCTQETLVLLRLCRTPAVECMQFQNDVRQIASKFNVDLAVLAEAMRRGQAILHLRAQGLAGGTLLAARDTEPDADAK